jgi:Ca2+-binding EF-hand superfamily protein
LIIQVCLYLFLEFLASAAKKKEIFKEDKLAEAFKAFDTDNSGKISVKEIAAVLKLTDQEEIKKIEKIVSDNDINNDGEIDMDEFISMMSKLDL